ncbi:MAG: pyrroline-5-carboxylate reductase [Deltaproteobacteria bacterium]
MNKIGFIGAGNMAEALIKGLIVSGRFSPEEILINDALAERVKLISSEYGVRGASSNGEVARLARVVVLAVKPAHIEGVIREVGEFLKPEQIIVSIAAGVRTETMTKALGRELKIARVMPNTPALALAGASGIYCNSSVTGEESESVRDIFGSVGVALIVENEDLLDAVTGLSGSGPAFAAIFIEALADGGVAAGLARGAALNLAAQTVLGTARMIIEGKIPPAELKDKVASPAGTTIEGIRELETRGFRGSVISAVVSAARKSKELSKGGK